MRYISLSSCSSSGEANTRLGGRGGGLRRCFVIQIFNHYLFDTLKKGEKMNKIKKKKLFVRCLWNLGNLW